MFQNLSTRLSVKIYDIPETNTWSAENRMRSNLELLPVINVKSRPRYISALK
jgi:hypothetical protein